MFKKVFAAMLAGLFISAPAFAEVKMSGSYFIKGNANQSAFKDVDTYRYYESDLEIKTQFIVDENTSVNVVAEAFDTNWVNRANIGSNAHVPTYGQNYFEISKATLTHKFATGTTFNGGVAGNADSWGTLFGDDASRIYYISADQALPFGTLTVLTEKWDEGLVTDAAGNPIEDADGNVIPDSGLTDDDLDVDGYLLGLSMNAGGLDIKPAVYYKNDKAQDQELAKFMVAATGKVGAFDIESEFGFADYSDDNFSDAEGSVFGAWVDVATTVGSFNINTGLLYAGADDEVYYVAGDELCPMEILGDDVLIDGATLFRVKAAKAVTEKVSVDFSAAYAFSNVDDDIREMGIDRDEDGDIEISFGFDKVYELDANASFKASDAVTLSCGIAYLDGDDAAGKAFPQARIDSYAKINVAF